VGLPLGPDPVGNLLNGSRSLGSQIEQTRGRLLSERVVEELKKRGVGRLRRRHLKSKLGARCSQASMRIVNDDGLDLKAWSPSGRCRDAKHGLPVEQLVEHVHQNCLAVLEGELVRIVGSSDSELCCLVSNLRGKIVVRNEIANRPLALVQAAASDQ